MPSKTKAQAKLMRAVAHGWKPKGKKKPPVSIAVAKEFMKEDMKAKRSGRGTLAAGDR